MWSWDLLRNFNFIWCRGDNISHTIPSRVKDFPWLIYFYCGRIRDGEPIGWRFQSFVTGKEEEVHISIFYFFYFLKLKKSDFWSFIYSSGGNN